MKIATSILAAVLFTGTLGVVNTAIGADGILSKDQLTAGSYCHEKFPAMRQSTLDDGQPTLKDSSTGDVIDFYGPCDEKPTGKDQVQMQRIEDQHRWYDDSARDPGGSPFRAFRTTAGHRGGGASGRRSERADRHRQGCVFSDGDLECFARLREQLHPQLDGLAELFVGGSKLPGAKHFRCRTAPRHVRGGSRQLRWNRFANALAGRAAPLNASQGMDKGLAISRSIVENTVAGKFRRRRTG